LVSAPETVYAKTTGGSIDYQVVGAGPPDVFVAKQALFPIDLMWDEPRFVRFLHGLSSFSRHIWFDQRGMGSSDPIAPVQGRDAEGGVSLPRRCHPAWIGVPMWSGLPPTTLFRNTSSGHRGSDQSA
jgi:hypothetical protein